MSTTDDRELDHLSWVGNLKDAREFCNEAFETLALDPEPYAQIIAELMAHATLRERDRCVVLCEDLAGRWERTAARIRSKRRWFSSRYDGADYVEAAAHGLRKVAQGIREGWRTE